MARQPSYARPDRATLRTECRASTGPNGEWVPSRIEAPYTIRHAMGAKGWHVLGRINGAPHYVTSAVEDAATRNGFRTWRDALAAVRRLAPTAQTILRTSDSAERIV